MITRHLPWHHQQLVRTWLLIPFLPWLLMADAQGQDLLNLDFGSGTQSAKQGAAALGLTADDFWNLYSRDDGAGGFRTTGTVTDLRWSDHRVSPMSVTVTNAPGAWGNESVDPMFQVYLYPFAASDIIVRLQGVETGDYRLLVYAHGLLDGENGVITVSASGVVQGPLSTTTQAGWNTTAWKDGQQYVDFNPVEVGEDGEVVIRIQPGTTGLAVVNGLQFLRIHVPTPEPLELWNIDFSGHLNPVVRRKSGLGAIGVGADDYWNLYSRDDGFGGFLQWNALPNLKLFDGTETMVGLTVTNAPGLWLSGHTDPMLDSYLYPFNQGNVVVTLTNLPAGLYDVFFYAHGLLDGENGVVQLESFSATYGTRTTTTSSDWKSEIWIEDQQFVRFQSVQVASDIPVVITVKPGTTGLAVINGLQLLRHQGCTPAPTGLVAWWRGEGDAKDAAGRNDGYLVGGVGFDEGFVGQSFWLDGESGRVQVPASGSLWVTNLTVAAWVNPDDVSMQRPILEYAADTGAAGVHLWLSVASEGGFSLPGTLFANVRDELGSDRTIVSEAGLIEAGVWSHVALTYDPATSVGRLYVNGQQVAEAELGTFLPNTALPLHVGYRPELSSDAAGGNLFAGGIDEVSIYQRALDPGEIAAIHAAGRDGKCPEVLLILTTMAGANGQIERSPNTALYGQGVEVELTAVPEPGFAFLGWFGDLVSDQNPLRFVMDRHTRMVATFVDVTPPAIMIDSPTTGTTSLEWFRLAGTVADNVRVTELRWEWNGQDMGGLSLLDGAFEAEEQRLVPGTNHILVRAFDAAGNSSEVEVLVVWVPTRMLRVADMEPRQEGQFLRVPLWLNSPGDVSGMAFLLRYDPAYLTKPEAIWTKIGRNHLTSGSYDGELHGWFQLINGVWPDGEQLVGEIVFRTRSVPHTLQSPISLEIRTVVDVTGKVLPVGNGAAGGQATILARRLTGDNNANHRLDIGDATTMQRLLAGLEFIRPWDVSGNDVNRNVDLEVGDVVRVLRAAVGIDPQPMPQGWEDDLTASRLSPQNKEAVGPHGSGGFVPTLSAFQAEPGESVTLQIWRAGVDLPFAGLTLRIEYPVEALRIRNEQAHRFIAQVPEETLVLWNLAPAESNYSLQSGRLTLGVSHAMPWPVWSSVMAEVTFEVQPGQSARSQWPIRIDAIELATDGFELFTLPASTIHYIARAPLPPIIETEWMGFTGNGFALKVTGEAGVTYVLEASQDLIEWFGVLTFEGSGQPLWVEDSRVAGQPHRFYRIRSF
jgi:hypothetical protein